VKKAKAQVPSYKQYRATTTTIAVEFSVTVIATFSGSSFSSAPPPAAA
jgi:hypothetical protein